MRKIVCFILLNFFICHYYAQHQTFKWAKSIVGIGVNGDASVFDSATDTLGNIYLVGEFIENADFDPGTTTYSLNPNTLFLNTCTFVSKLDSVGNLIWCKIFFSNSGSYKYCSGRLITVDENKNIIISGTFAGVVDFNPGPSTYTISSNTNWTNTANFSLKLDNAGNFIWANSIKNIHTRAITNDASGNIYYAGEFKDTVDFNSGAGVYKLVPKNSAQVFILKTDPNANFIWAKALNDTTGYSYGFDLRIDNNNNIIIAGNFQFTVDFDPGSGSSILNSTFVPSTFNSFILKLDGSGNFIWVSASNGAGNEISSSVATDYNNNIYTVGTFSGTADFNPAGGSSMTSSLNGSDLYILKLDPAGNFLWTKQVPIHSPLALVGKTTISLDILSNLYITGSYYGNTDFDPGLGTFSLIADSIADAFVLKLNASGNFIWAKGIGGRTVYPRKNFITRKNELILVGAHQSYADHFYPDTCSLILLSNSHNQNGFICNIGPNISTPVGINELTTNSYVSIYPNPANQHLQIISDKEFTKFVITNLTGQILISKNVKNTTFELNTLELADGVYFIEVFYDSGVKTTKRLIINH